MNPYNIKNLLKTRNCPTICLHHMHSYHCLHQMQMLISFQTFFSFIIQLICRILDIGCLVYLYRLFMEIKLFDTKLYSIIIMSFLYPILRVTLKNIFWNDKIFSNITALKEFLMLNKIYDIVWKIQKNILSYKTAIVSV